MQYTYETFKCNLAERLASAERRRVEKSRNQNNETKNSRKRR